MGMRRRSSKPALAECLMHCLHAGYGRIVSFSFPPMLAVRDRARDAYGKCAYFYCPLVTSANAFCLNFCMDASRMQSVGLGQRGGPRQCRHVRIFITRAY
ncbi:hypothetical protein EVAR_93034_1 [Eumeta japonica]|uniref:Uncharacterized protein n=1 Tax=Eumeta variegata TaxID=151549 RepID=A0A4C1SC98_EUMVA|nr:hypothetical protein EVAR_93034_1 [Eumeta japonica]